VLGFGETLVTSISDLLVGDIVILAAGDCIPVDGIVSEVTSLVNTSSYWRVLPSSYFSCLRSSHNSPVQGFRDDNVEEETAKELVTAVSPNTFVRRLAQFLDLS
jgi:hypothetical protein